MPTGDGSSLTDIFGIMSVLILVAANGFFVAAEFSLVAIRRSRVAELVATGRANAAVLQRAVDSLDAHLAATQLGITISSLALGWIGEPALAHLIQPWLSALPGSWATAGSHAIAVAIAFVIITALHIVLGELAPKSLALQRSEATALAIVRPLRWFLFLLRPVILALNNLGNLVLHLCGLQPGAGEGALHSSEELKMLVEASQKAGLLEHQQQEVVARVLNIGDRRIADIMTPRRDVEWIDVDDPHDVILKTIRECRHDQLLVGKGTIDEPLGMILKHDLLDMVLEGRPIDPLSVVREPMNVHEATTIFRALDRFKDAPSRLVCVIDEYGTLNGIVTQTDLLEALAGELPDEEEEAPYVVERQDGSLLIDGTMSAHDAFDRLGIRTRPESGIFHTFAGFALFRLGHLPETGERFVYEDWQFEIIDMDGRRIDKILATREQPADSSGVS
ncbi:hemolysin [Hyphomicrobium methylovorum]|uniref:hemolysin family protein n=1 Tax=Hyphomicrobium methylovorum TaxID=84 RepID=UPI0015E68DF7|nr:hemolysin family protein [Hyphomicrobium methylovorum]MBA2125732.1 hemolysin [Hyphomicrobium methylovorum]